MPHTASQVKRATWTALVVNVALAAAKMIAGALANSMAVFADGVHSLTDLASDLALLVGVRYWTQPSDRKHPYGHGRIETMIAWCVGFGLAATGAGLGYRAVLALAEPGEARPGVLAFAAALASIAAKEVLFQWTVRVGRRIKSSALVANAWHHRSDALSSVPAAAAVGGAILFPGWGLLDPVAALAVCLMVLHAAWRIMAPATRELVDAAPPEDLHDSILDSIRAFPHVKTAHALRLRSTGAKVLMDFHLLVEPQITVQEGHDIAENLKAQLHREYPDVADIVIHVEPDLEAERG